MIKEIFIPGVYDRPKGYTRMVKPYADGTTRRQRIDWCIENCKKEFTASIGELQENTPYLLNEYVQSFYFECEQDAMMFGLSN